MNIIIHGSIALDRIMNFPGAFRENILPDKIHDLSVSFQVDRIDILHGGVGGNIAYNVNMLQKNATVLASVGTDGKDYVAALAASGIDTSAVVVDDTLPTPSAYIITDKHNSQITAFSPGAAAVPVPYDIASHSPEETILCFSPANNVRNTMELLRATTTAGIPYIFDPGQTTNDFSSDDLREGITHSHTTIVNDYEQALVMKILDVTEEELRALPQHRLIVTRGENGSTIYDGNEEITLPVVPAEVVVDPTGAGDAYRAGLLVGMATGMNSLVQGQLAACAASYAIEHIGTQTHSWTMEVFNARYRSAFGTDSPLTA